MEIEQSSLWREVRAVQQASTSVHNYWTADIHANGLTITALKMLSMDNLQDFTTGFADELIVELVLPRGVYASKIYPYQSNLEITLYKNPLVENSDVGKLDSPRQTERFTAIMFDMGSDIIQANGMAAPTQQALDLSDIIQVKFQLISKAVEQIRSRYAGTIGRYATVEDIIKGILTKESSYVTADGQQMVVNVDMVPADNKTVRTHLPIEQPIRLTDVPGYVQEHFGVYSTGLSVYIHKDRWFVWPTYNTTRFEEAEETITFINVPKNKMPGTERTFRTVGRNTIALVTGQVRFVDNQDKRQLNLGNGARFMSAEKLGKFVTVKDGKATASRGGAVTEVVGTARENGINSVPMSDSGITSNSWNEYSKLAQRQGRFLDITWENCDSTKVYPGVPIKFLYLDGDEIKTLTGLILAAHHYTEVLGEGLLASRHRTNAALSLYVA